MNLTREDVQEILRLLDAAAYDELHLETERFKLSLKRDAQGGWTEETRTTARANVMRAAASTAQPTAKREAIADDDVNAIRSPMMGTFYRAPKPGAPPFVEAGAQVTPDTVIGIVETMKLMNSVVAGRAGTIAEICADNATFVEQNQVLMRLRP